MTITECDTTYFNSVMDVMNLEGDANGVYYPFVSMGPQRIDFGIAYTLDCIMNVVNYYSNYVLVPSVLHVGKPLQLTTPSFSRVFLKVSDPSKEMMRMTATKLYVRTMKRVLFDFHRE